MTDENAESEDESDPEDAKGNQYGGGSEEIDAEEQTERREESVEVPDGEEGGEVEPPDDEDEGEIEPPDDEDEGEIEPPDDDGSDGG